MLYTATTAARRWALRGRQRTGRCITGTHDTAVKRYTRALYKPSPWQITEERYYRHWNACLRPHAERLVLCREPLPKPVRALLHESGQQVFQYVFQCGNLPDSEHVEKSKPASHIVEKGSSAVKCQWYKRRSPYIPYYFEYGGKIFLSTATRTGSDLATAGTGQDGGIAEPGNHYEYCTFYSPKKGHLPSF